MLIKTKTVYVTAELKAPGIIDRASVETSVITSDAIIFALLLIFFRVYKVKWRELKLN